MIGREVFLNHYDVSRETLERLDTYAALLEKWNPAINLVSRTTLKDIWTRHFLDSAQVFEVAPNVSGIWADLGTGGGFPGIVVAILGAEQRPDTKVVCVESDTRKAAFLMTVLRETGVAAEVRVDRVEAVEPLRASVLSARALAPLSTLLEFAERHLKNDGIALFSKGERWRAEVERALEKWSFHLDTYPSQTDSAATILKLGDIKRV